MKRLLAVTTILSALAVSAVALYAARAYAAQVDTARFASWPSGEAFMRMNGEPIHRATLTPDGSTAEDNSNASGGGAVTGTLYGGERICVQTPEAAYVQVIASASLTAALSFRVNANEGLFANCFTTQSGATKVSGLCVTGSCAGIKLFEIR